MELVKPVVYLINSFAQGISPSLMSILHRESDLAYFELDSPYGFDVNLHISQIYIPMILYWLILGIFFCPWCSALHQKMN